MTIVFFTFENSGPALESRTSNRSKHSRIPVFSRSYTKYTLDSRVTHLYVGLALK